MKFDTSYSHGRVKYGLLRGNEIIVFIKAGAGGSIPGYRGKYLLMACRIRERLGATVICASNPDCEHQTDEDEMTIRKVADDAGFSDYELRLIGVSDGAYQILSLATRFQQSKVFLGINMSFVDPDSLTRKLSALPHIRKILVYGTEDDDYSVISPVIKTVECDNLVFRSVCGADHQFTGKLDEFIGLADLI